MAIQTNFPALKPTLLLDFANVGELDPRVTFARASAATYYGTQTAKAEENLLVRSQEFETDWSNSNTTDTANTEVAPDGTTTADTLTATASAGAHNIVQTVSFFASQRYACSVFVKQGTYTYFQIAFGTQSGTHANFDVTTGAGVVGTSAGVVSTSIVDAGNGWFRCIVVFDNTNATAVRLNMAASASATREESWTALGTETVFLWGAQLEQRSAVTAYTPTTDQPITNYIPVLESAAAGVARFDHNPTTFESLGLLIEESRTNLLVQSEDFSTTWSITGTASIGTNTVIAPDGTLTADKFVLGDTITSNNAAVTQSATKPATSAPYTASVYIKAGEFNSLRLILRDAATAANFVQVWFNAATGVIAQAASAAGTFTAASATITPVGNGWYRCSVTGTTSTETSLNVRIFNYQDGTSLATGDGYSGLYIWGAQLEAGAFPTSYIPTVASQVTRSSDAASMTGADFSSWYRQDEGTLYFEAASRQPSFSVLDDRGHIVSLSAATSSDTFELFFVDAGLSILSRKNGGSFSTSAAIASKPILQNQFYKGAATYLNDSTTVTLDGNPASSATREFSGGNATQLILGRGIISISRLLDGTIKKLAFYPKALTAAELQGLTS